MLELHEGLLISKFEIVDGLCLVTSELLEFEFKALDLSVKLLPLVTLFVELGLALIEFRLSSEQLSFVVLLQLVLFSLELRELGMQSLSLG